jgi:predicted NAD/FAD-dependent oxidoreductase
MASPAWTEAHPAVVSPRLRRARGSFGRRRGCPVTVRAVSSQRESKNDNAAREGSGDRGPERKRVVIVGGGMAGLGCLDALKSHAHVDVTLLESTRVLGGRVRSKTALGALAWDTGASYFTVKEESGPFAKALRAAVAAGVVQTWTRDTEDGELTGAMGTASTRRRSSDGRVVVDDASFRSFEAQKKRLYVGVPGAAAFPAFVAERVVGASFPEASWVGDDQKPGVPEVLCGAHVDRVKQLGDGAGNAWPVHPHGVSRRRWGFMARCKEGGHMWYKPLECDAIVLATNAHAVASLLGQVELGNPSDDPGDPSPLVRAKRRVAAERLERLRSAAARTRGAACWSLTVAFDAPLRLKYDALKLRAPFDGDIVFIANESSKPRRGAAASAGWGYRWAEVGRAPATGAGECWVAHASPAWSAEHCELPPGEAAAKLCAAFLSLVERDGAGDPEPVHCKATRWRFAFPTPDEDEPGRENGREEKKTTKAAKERAKPARGNSAPYVFDPSLMLGACGDWASGPGAGDAYESGAALGAAVAKRFAASRAADEAA